MAFPACPDPGRSVNLSILSVSYYSQLVCDVVIDVVVYRNIQSSIPVYTEVFDLPADLS